jgi:centromere protein C
MKTNGLGSQNGRTNRHVEQDSDDDNDDDDDAVLQGHQASFNELSDEDEEEPMDILDMGGDDDIEPLAATEEEVEDEDEDPVEEDPVEEVKPRKRGRKPKARDAEESIVEEEALPAAESEEVDEEPIKKKRGRPGKNAPAERSDLGAKSPKRRRPGRPSLTNDDVNGSNETDPAGERETKRQKTETKSKFSNAAASKTPAAKGKPGRKRKSSGIGADSPAVIPRPPMPKQRGLQSLRREEFAVKTTRSGRISTKPLEFWRGEHYEIDPNDEELLEDKAGRRIKVGSTIKGVVRVNYEEAPKTKRGRAKGSGTDRRKRRVSDMEEEDEYREDWEDNPGRMVGECIYWYSDYEENPPQEEDQVEVDEMELGISEAAIQMRDIKDATFKFSKTLTLPFFGTGLVDLPPQSEKRSKNARKMQMGFFVHYGNVKVTVSQTTFRISKGGQFFVPRGKLIPFFCSSRHYLGQS